MTDALGAWFARLMHKNNTSKDCDKRDHNNNNILESVNSEAEANADLRGILLLCRTDVNTKEIQDTILS